MSLPPAVILAPDRPEWSDAWAHPEYFRGVTLKRIAAYALDVLVVALLAVPVWFVGMFLTAFSFGLLAPLKAMALVLLPLVYHIGLVASRRSATLGMRVMGLRVMSVAADSISWGGRPTLFQAMIQVVAFYGSMALTGALVLLIALFNPRRRTLHDWLAGTVVVNDLGSTHAVG